MGEMVVEGGRETLSAAALHFGNRAWVLAVRGKRKAKAKKNGAVLLAVHEILMGL